ncbi:MAG: hypothetical protein A2557_10845 [Candidatus Lambdaproteobacteria bacterium RIFOXYD2_FULL_56_26]|uniref:FecR protein domain-containing protein n=1 Tax=Candidatus Lambdaproteobacteria bacterium RIFOXYD2_FULL_56_26 TaxID=1817773 RepID=A0A1F6H1M3_9PROT|nr:MAG: hypothetical protein A2557_10845 [Candidatus Lambdaproteobacteria bacterium RIFOXYD2_FULL_56_26]
MGKKSLLLPLLLVLSLALCWGQSALAQEVGQLLLLQGKVKIQGPQGERMLSEVNQTLPVFAQDSLHTGTGTRAKLTLRSGAEQVDLFSETYLSLSTYEPGQSLLSLPVGKAKFLVNYLGLATRPKFGVRTVNAVVGIKGTEFVLQSLGNTTNLLTLEGTVGFAAQSAPEITILVEKNQASQTLAATPPSPPVTVPQAVQENIAGSDSADLAGWDAAGVKIEPVSTDPTPEAKPTPKESSDPKGETQDPGPGPALETVEGQVEQAKQQVDQAQETVNQERVIQTLKDKPITLKVTD